jgi:hypothetical protein
MKNFLTSIVTPAFITFNAHCWFAYALVCTFHDNYWAAGVVVILAGVKEFYVDKHWEIDQTFDDNLQDFMGYLTGVVFALMVHRFL